MPAEVEIRRFARDDNVGFSAICEVGLTGRRPGKAEEVVEGTISALGRS